MLTPIDLSYVYIVFGSVYDKQETKLIEYEMMEISKMHGLRKAVST